MSVPTNDSFRKKLLQWHERIHRPLPWKGEENTYFIWLSEIILQQTRVEYGKQYYQAFKEKFPTVHDLANASEDEVLKMWQGLGYYSRARNLHETAKFISQEKNGHFPETYNELLELKGVGPYTASAIASFAFNKPHAVVDGNVYRILARYFGIEAPIDTSESKKRFARLADDLIDVANPGKFNQAMMDFGALQCKPSSPPCGHCPMRKKCVAYNENKVEILPVKSKKNEKTHRYFNYLVFYDGDYTYLQKRAQQDIWKNLYEFPLLETKQPPHSFESLKQDIGRYYVSANMKDLNLNGATLYHQTLTHQHIYARFFEISLHGDAELHTANLIPVARKNLNNFAYPKVIDWFLKSKSLYLSIIR